ncbi:MAG: GNAT family N-acetyltransferase [Chitinophagia bacterium]|nr:GNAT family N-acetyltransferase [Chitinophagia bacterium]
MTDIKIRKALKEDCPRMMELVRELAVYERAPDAVTVSQTHFEESGFGANPVWWAYIAETDAEGILGFALYYIRYSTWKGQRMYLEDIIVTEAARRMGIGTLLMDALIAGAKERQFCGITWQVLEWNTLAIAFYQKYNAHFDSEWINVSLSF